MMIKGKICLATFLSLSSWWSSSSFGPNSLQCRDQNHDDKKGMPCYLVYHDDDRDCIVINDDGHYDANDDDDNKDISVWLHFELMGLFEILTSMMGGS